jgi:site-specific DNA-methyltransferase (adenine-specific)
VARIYYDRNGITLYHADYREIVSLLAHGSVGAIISDPPYATTALAWDKAIDWAEFWDYARRLCPATSPMVLFAAGSFVPKLIQTNARNFRYELIWAKLGVTGFLDARRRPLRAHENILVFARQLKGGVYNPQMTEGKVHARGNNGPAAAHYSTIRRSSGGKTNLYYPRSVLHFGLEKRPDGRSWHPTAKPIELVDWLVRTYSNPGDVILDPFAGSGTTLAAALRTGRRAIGVELNEEYCARAVERLQITERQMVN